MSMRGPSQKNSALVLTIQAVLMFSFGLLLGCVNSALKPTSLKNYISLELPYKEYEVERLGLEKKWALTLKNRGEAHITLLTPPEYEKLKQKIPPVEIHQMAETFLKTKPQFEKICVGSGSVQLNNHLEKTYYVVVSSKDFLKFRESLTERAQLSKAEFDPAVFYPHVTLGFTLRDLHLEDGLKKDASTCLRL